MIRIRKAGEKPQADQGRIELPAVPVDERVAVGRAAQHARGDDVVGPAVEQGGDDPADVPGLVLAVGVAQDQVPVAMSQGELAGRLEGLGISVVTLMVDHQHLSVGGDPDRAVGAAVVDDEDVPAGKIQADLVQHGTDLSLLIFRRQRDEDVLAFFQAHRQARI